jgi:DNA-binding MarR family transcriptional regulator
MTNPQPSLLELAGTLSAGQLAALMRHYPGQYYGSSSGGWGDSARDPASFCRAGRDLMDMGLIEWHPNPKDSRTRLTQHGLAVRAALQKEQTP